MKTTHETPKLCECGCGQTAPLAPHTDSTRGWVKGQPLRFVKGHNSRGVPSPIKDKHRRPWLERFWEKVEILSPSECWEWKGTIRRKYGSFYKDKKEYIAHRFSYELHNGPIPEGLYVLHKCDNPPCVNPNHLFVGTPQDNATDMMNKGRHRHRWLPK